MCVLGVGCLPHEDAAGNCVMEQDHGLTWSPPGPIPLYRHLSNFFTAKGLWPG